MSAPRISAPVRVPVYIDVPERLRARAAWTLDTLLSLSGGRADAVYDAARAPACALAYAAAPVAGVPTLPVVTAAVDLLLGERPLPPSSFRRQRVGDVVVPGVFPAAEEGGFAVPFELVTSAFVLLAAWDEHTSSQRDRHGRLPYAASVFAANPTLSTGAAPVDGYALCLRVLLEERLAALGTPLPRDPGWDGARFAVACTHDIDHVKRWTARGLAGASRRAARAAARRDRAGALFELQTLRHAMVHDIPNHIDPYWPFPDLPQGERSRGLAATYFILASHGHASDGADPAAYERRRSELVRLLRRHGSEIGIHGNERDRRDLVGLLADRARLSTMAETHVEGMRFHYLRCLYHETLPLLEQAGFVYDSSLAFAEQEGYRCGCSFPFHPYDLTHERPLRLIELPLAVMDSTLQEQRYRGLDASEALSASLAVLERARLSGGAAAVLWHQNRFDERLGAGYGDVYWRILDWVRDHGGRAGSAAEIVHGWLRRLGEEPPAPDAEPPAVAAG